MKQIFEARGFFAVPDGTQVSPFLNATDANQSDVPWDALGDLSLAAGRIDPGMTSWIHCHPIITQIAYVTSGELSIQMKGPEDDDPYTLLLRKGQAVVTRAGTWFQLENVSSAASEVLYMASPTYVFSIEDGQIIYDDAVLIAKSWDDAPASAAGGFSPEQIYEANAARAEAKQSLAMKKGVSLPPLAGDIAHRLPQKFDYLAPDKSEI